MFVTLIFSSPEKNAARVLKTNTFLQLIIPRTLHIPQPPQTRRTPILYANGLEAPPKPPVIKQKSGGGGDEDGMISLMSSEVLSHAEDWSQNARLYYEENQLTENLGIYSKMMEFASKMTGWSARRHRAFGLMKSKCLVGIACGRYQLPQGGNRPPLVPTLAVDLLGFDPKIATTIEAYKGLNFGRMFMSELKEVCLEQAVYLDCSPLRSLGPTLALYSLMGSVQVLEEDPVEENPLVLPYLLQKRSPIVVVDDVPDSLDFGPYWYEGITNDGVLFYFRHKLHAAVNEFEISFTKPTAGNATGSGTVGNPRIIKSNDFGGDRIGLLINQAELYHIQKQISSKISRK